MNIKIITLHAMHNPGSVFQAYALQNYLKSSNEVEIIDYRPDYFYKENSNIKYYIKKYLFFFSYYKRNSKFNRFIKEKMILTPRFETYSELVDAELVADLFIVGSDQLWNSDYKCGNDPAFYLQFVKNMKKISYSTSVGKAEIDTENALLLSTQLSSFSSLAVREKCTAVQLSELLNKPVKWVCDPVFLIDRDQYLPFIRTQRPLDEEYVMVYMAPKSKELDAIVAHFYECGIKVVLVGGMTKRCRCDLHVKDMGPEDFLTYIYHAKTVISTSFHATAFCHIFRKDFIAILPEKNGERIMSLLRLSGNEHRVLKGCTDYASLLSKIDWEKADLRLQKHIAESKEYLDSQCN